MNRVKINFYLRPGKVNMDGSRPVIASVCCKGRKWIGTGISIQPEEWDSRKQQVKGKNASKINPELRLISTRFEELETQLNEAGREITAESLVSTYRGKKSVQQETLLQAIDKMIEEAEQMVKCNMLSPGRLKRYRVFKAKIQKFVKWKYGKSDIGIKVVTKAFISDLDLWLTSSNGLSRDTANGHLKILKKLYRRVCYVWGWTEHYPFNGITFKNEIIERMTLSELELDALRGLKLEEKLDRVRDCFLFCCLTGLRISDAQVLARNNIQDGQKKNCKVITRLRSQKTKEDLYVPLLPEALEILAKYDDWSQSDPKNRLLPFCSTQKYNDYLKILAERASIPFNLTSHIARHTFATIAINYGTPLTTIQGLLGHRNIRTTQNYAKINKRTLEGFMDHFPAAKSSEINIDQNDSEQAQ